MSEELESFNRIKNFQVVVDYEKDEVKTIYELLPASCKKVETALKELEVKREVIGDILTGDDEKKLKAFEIIKKKNVKIDVLKYQSDVVFYNMAVFEKEEILTQEEYDLLKEVLLWD